MSKKIRYFLYTLIVVIFILLCFIISKPSQPHVAGVYFGQTTPDSIPQVFAPGFISDQLNERDAAFTPDGNEFYFSLWTGSFGVILQTKQVDGRWSKPDIAPFSGMFSDVEPFVTPDGSRLYFASNRPVEGSNVKDYDIWYVEKVNVGWGNAVRIDSTINSSGNEFYPTLTKSGALYFTAHRQDSYGGEDIYRSEFRDGAFQQPENLGEAINSARGEFNALIAPDESFLLFSSSGRIDEIGGGDLYVSFNKNGQWTTAVNLGEPVNSSRLDYCPALSPDGSFFLFTSRRSSIAMDQKSTEPLKNLQNQLTSYGNGTDDLYWVRCDFISSLRQRAIAQDAR